MKKLLLTAAAACALAAPAMAEESGLSLSGNVAMTTDYVFRGVTQTDNGPAIQGGFDAGYGLFYAGAWGSNVDFGGDESMELDVYAGVKPTLGPVSTDIGIVGYFYPGASDAANLDYMEVYGKASIAPTEAMTLGAAVFYSPENTGDTGDAYYLEANAGFTVSDALAISGAFGYQDVEAGVLDGSDSYLTWNIGATYTVAGFGIDLRYTDTDIKESFDPNNWADSKAVLTIKRAL